MQFRVLSTDEQIVAAFPLMVELRPHLETDSFLASVRLQEREGFRLVGGFSGSTLVVLAGVRESRTLMRGPHLFVDDLVTLTSEQGKGHGKAMLRWLAAEAAGRGIARIYLDSRDTALGFYRRVGFEAQTSVVCRIAVDQFLAPPQTATARS
ncbi:MAG: GCN5-related N-acetyltransferase [Phycisphaerales bacterium]|nr:GCN5-related N-acetyltransferase [Phycisphaerales bacterium]MDB5354492.1 GCN5-related N-acetyltransferase [Phycisphaerales bacterium]